jgi:hypothetical protein
MRAMRRAPLLLLLLLVSSSGCSDQECIPIEVGDDGYVNPFQGYQDVGLSPAVIELADVPFGGSGTAQITLRNDGDQDLIIESFAMDDWSDANWNVDPSTVPDLLEPGESAVIDVIFVNDQAQDSIASFDVFSNDPDEERASVGLVGRADRERPDARLTPIVIDFGFTYTGTEVSAPLTLTNFGDAVLEITAAELTPSGGAFSVEPSAFDLAGVTVKPGAAAALEITFVPTNVQSAAAQMTVWTTDPQRPTLTAQLRGNGDDRGGCTPPSIELTSSTAPFAIEVDVGAHLQISGVVSDAEQPASPMLVELFRDGALIEDVDSSAGGLFLIDIDIDTYEVDEVFDEFPRGLATFEVRVTDACPLSSSVNLVGTVDADAALDPTDGDGDGWSTADGDCNDADPTVYPGRLEDADTVDNDCDGTADEGTTAYDDDGDGTSEDEGDCDDTNPEIHPEADERPNYRDDDCDGSVDEGTAFADDDGDGLSEISGDCDDDDDRIFTGAIEWCDGLDNNCTGGIDEDCAEEVRAPQIIGDVVTDKFQIPLGTVVDAEVRVLSDDPSLSYLWTTDKGSFVGVNDTAAVQWQAPSDVDSNLGLIGTFATLQVTVTDSQGRVVNGFGNLLFAEGAGSGVSPVGGVTCGCAMTGSGRPTRLALPVLLMTILRRKNRWLVP